MASKARFQARTPVLIGAFQASGNELSTYQTIGFLTVTFCPFFQAVVSESSSLQRDAST